MICPPSASTNIQYRVVMCDKGGNNQIDYRMPTLTNDSLFSTDPWRYQPQLSHPSARVGHETIQLYKRCRRLGFIHQPCTVRVGI